MKCDWDGVKRLGAYLGPAIDDALTEKPEALKVICRSFRAFNKKYPRETCARLADIILRSDFSGLPPEVDRAAALTRDAFSRLDPAGNEQEFLDFSDAFRRFVRWFTVAVDASSYANGLKKECISLDRPGVKSGLSELKELPSRRLGELNFSHRTQGYTAIYRYVEALLNRYENKALTEENCRNIIEVMSKVTGYPAYFKSISAAQKLAEARPILVAISELQLYQASEPAKADLLSALGILLFNIFPTPKLLKFIAKLQPSPGNDALQYDYNGILAMSFMLAGRLDEAADYNKKALEYAGDEEKRAYVHIMDSCLCLSRGRAEDAVNALYRCSALTKDRRMKSTALFYMGIIYYEEDKIADALEAFRLSRVGLNDELDIMNACNNIGTCAMLQGDLKAAMGEFENVEYIGRYASSNTAKTLKSVAFGNLGLIHMNMSNYDLAVECFKEALKLYRDTHDKKGVANQLGNIGLALKAKRDHKAALEYFKAALNVAFLEDYLEGALFSLAQIDQLMALEGRYEDAEAFRQEVVRRNPRIAKMLYR